MYSNKKIEKPTASFEAVNSRKDDNSAISVQIEKNFSRGNVNQIYLIQDRIELRKNKNYKVTFYVKSAIPKDQIKISIV